MKKILILSSIKFSWFFLCITIIMIIVSSKHIDENLIDVFVISALTSFIIWLIMANISDDDYIKVTNKADPDEIQEFRGLTIWMSVCIGSVVFFLLSTASINIFTDGKYQIIDTESSKWIWVNPLDLHQQK